MLFNNVGFEVLVLLLLGNLIVIFEYNDGFVLIYEYGNDWWIVGYLLVL